MLKKVEPSLADMLYKHVEKMTPEQVSALRAELKRTLPAYITEAVKRARAQASVEIKRDGKR